MSRIVIYAKSESELLSLTDFAQARGYVPTQVANGYLVSICNTLAKDDTLILRTVDYLDDDGSYGLATPALELLDRGVTIISDRENFVLKDDIGSKVAVGMYAMTNLIRKDSQKRT